jgi:hypothetical protein
MLKFGSNSHNDSIRFGGIASGKRSFSIRESASTPADFLLVRIDQPDEEDCEMDGEALARWVLAWFLASASLLLWEADAARAQAPRSDRNEKVGKTAVGKARTQTKRRNAASTGGQVTGAAQAPAGNAARQPPRREFSEAYRESLRRTVERRRQLRARRRAGAEAYRPPGAIVPWLMPPALIIRQTRDVHGEIGSFLDVLRR